MSDYKAEEICNGFWRIVDAKQCCIYLIEGEMRSLVIDTGMSEEPLFPFVKTLTDKPVDLILTHAHIDHMYRAEEFEKVYIHEKERMHYTKASQRLMNFGSIPFKLKRKDYPVNTYIPVAEGSDIDLGGLKIKCIGAFGHTPGSMLLIDETHQAVLCGDAVGSGSGVWMFLPDCTSVKDYRDSLEKTLEKLAPYKAFSYYGGHYEQDEGKYSHKLSYATFEDMYTLCCGIISKTLAPTPLTKLPVKVLFYYRYKTAAMVTRRGKVK